MGSEHATERVPLTEIREGDMLQNPKSGSWIKVTHTDSAAHDPIGSTTATEAKRSIPGTLRAWLIVRFGNSISAN